VTISKLEYWWDNLGYNKQKMAAIILENIRSAYNVWNMVRTADAFGFDVIISGYTASPLTHEKVKKTSLGAEKTVKIFEFLDNDKALDFAKQNYKTLISAETGEESVSLKDFDFKQIDSNFAIIVWNEVEWILPQTLSRSDYIVSIPMNWEKESLNVWQSSAIFMWEFWRNFH